MSWGECLCCLAESGLHQLCERCRKHTPKELRLGCYMNRNERWPSRVGEPEER
jgi:hypothetical protein